MQLATPVRGHAAIGNLSASRNPVSQGAVFWIVIAALVYQAVLCMIHTNLHSISTALVALSEALIYIVCIGVLLRHIRLEFVALMTAVAAYLFLMAIVRNQLDAKGFRDVVIPLLFYWLGREAGSIQSADRLLKILIAIVLFFGLFELLFLAQYSKLFNIFSYYVSQGGLSSGTNWAKDSVLGLNGIRPEGIGRTILPSVFGSHRVSSVFLEPVSLGNFAVIVAAWGLSKERSEIKKTLLFVAAAVVMIALSDSRYGMLTLGLLLVMRALLRNRAQYLMMVFPLLCGLMLLAVGEFFNGRYGDNILGRLFVSGKTLLAFDLNLLFGISGYAINFGDMGYPSLLTRLGLVLCIVLWIAFWMIHMKDQRGERFRAYASLYMALILCVSGTSLFALKTAGVLWFLIGCCSKAALRNESSPTTPNRTNSVNATPVASIDFSKKASHVH